MFRVKIQDLTPVLLQDLTPVLLQIYQVAAVDQQVLLLAFNSGFNDYEDAVLHSSAIKAGAEAIVTRNIKDFSASEIPVFTPEEYLIRVSDCY